MQVMNYKAKHWTKEAQTNYSLKHISFVTVTSLERLSGKESIDFFSPCKEQCWVFLTTSVIVVICVVWYMDIYDKSLSMFFVLHIMLYG